jgi:aminopeptidase N
MMAILNCSARRAGACVLLALSLAACDRPEVPAEQQVLVEKGVSQALAEQRSQRLGNIVYKLHFAIPLNEEAPIQAHALIRFELTDNSTPLQLDFRADSDSIRSLSANGAAVAYEFVDEHIVLPADALRVGHNELEVDFRAGSGSLNRNPEYLYTLFVPDRARTVFPLFDQPDLKAHFELSLLLPGGWTALSNAPVEAVVEQGEQTEYRFARSDLISSYLFSFVAGEFESVTRKVDGRLMTLLHRETDAAKVVRNMDAIFSLHAESLAWMEEYTGIAYPFQSFAFALIPGFPYGGMEHVGAIQYRAASLLLDEAPPLTELLNRAQLIAHETAHMWFGNLVTMRWFDDVWTKEVFASFMADKMINPQFPQVDHALNFLVSHYPGAYAVDRSEGANPIRQELSNLNQAGQLYGNIIYDKAPIMMRQLELLTGEDGLRDGLRQYLSEFSYGNASWPELIAIVDERSDHDLARWSDVWVNTPGRPSFKLAQQGAVSLLQTDPTGSDRIWPQQFELLTLYREGAQRSVLLADQAVTELPPGPEGATPLATLYNADGRGYGLFPSEMGNLLAWDRLTDLQRGAALVTGWEQLLEGTAIDVEEYCHLLQDIVSRERNPLLLELALDQLHYVYFSLLDDGQQRRGTEALEELLWMTMLAQPDSNRTKLLFRYVAALASSPGRVQQLYEIWTGELSVDQLILEEDDFISLSQTLAIRMPEKSDEIIAQQLARTANPDSRRKLEFIAPSVSADPAVRDAFFDSLQDERNRQAESWVLEALRNLHYPARLQASRQYLLPSLELLQEIQVTGDIFFPGSWMEATLANYHAPDDEQVVRQFLAGRPNYSPQLRMKILQAADPLFRAVAIRR